MHSENTDKIIPALIAAKADFGAVKKTSENPFFHSKYADLEMVISATEKALLGNGLAVVQTPDGDGLRTTLYHTSGQWITGVQTLHPSKSDPQGWHGAQTYARRYGLMGVLGLAAEDDDGNTASVNSYVETSGIKPMTKEQAGILEDFRTADILVSKTTRPWHIHAPKWLKMCGKALLADLSEDQARKLIQECEKKVVIQREAENA